MAMKESDIIFGIRQDMANSTLSLEALLIKIGFRRPHEAGCGIDGCEQISEYYGVYTTKCHPLVVGTTFYFKSYATGIVYAASKHGNEFGREWTFIGPRAAIDAATNELRKKDKQIFAAEQSGEKARERALAAALK